MGPLGTFKCDHCPAEYSFSESHKNIECWKWGLQVKTGGMLHMHRVGEIVTWHPSTFTPPPPSDDSHLKEVVRENYQLKAALRKVDEENSRLSAKLTNQIVGQMKTEEGDQRDRDAIKVLRGLGGAWLFNGHHLLHFAYENSPGFVATHYDPATAIINWARDQVMINITADTSGVTMAVDKIFHNLHTLSDKRNAAQNISSPPAPVPPSPAAS